MCDRVVGLLVVADPAPRRPALRGAGAARGRCRSCSSATSASREQQHAAFPPHKVADNIWYVGTESLASFLVTTPAGHILINSSYEANVPLILASVAKLGFKIADIKIVLGSHAHGDHMEGDALVKQLTGAQVMAMQEDVPALERMRPGDKPHPVDQACSTTATGDAGRRRRSWRTSRRATRAAARPGR